MQRTQKRQSDHPTLSSARILSITLQPGHPEHEIIDAFKKIIEEGKLDYLIFIGPGSAMISDWDGHNLVPLFETAVAKKIPTFWITDAQIPPGRFPYQHERGVKFEYGNHPDLLGGNASCAYLASASVAIFAEVVADLNNFHRADSQTAFRKLVDKYGGRNEATIALTEHRLAQTSLNWREVWKDNK